MGLFDFRGSSKVELESVKTELSSLKKEMDRAVGDKIELLRSVNTENQNLSVPYIDDQFSKGTNWVYFGSDNLYPQVLNELYMSSPMHSSCVDFKTWTLIGNSYSFKNYDKAAAEEKMKIRHFERHNDLKRSAKKLAKDWVKHGRAIVLLHYDSDTKSFDSFKVVDPSEIRNSRVTLFNDVKRYFYSPDWIYRTNRTEFTPYTPVNTEEWQILEIKNDIGGSRSYGLPDWISSANWQKVSASLGLLHKSALENGIQPSVLFMYPYLMEDEEERSWVRGMQNNYKGVENYNRALKIEAQGKDDLPEVKVLETSDNHQLFEQTSKEQKEEIAISHNINPALMGVRVAGSLGQSDEIEFSAKQFEKLWVNDNRTAIEDFLNDIAVICGIKTEIVINETDVANIAKEMKVDAESVDNNYSIGKSTPKVNEHLKGLTAGDNSNIYRTIKDHGRGKLNKATAKTRLLAYGMDNETAEEALKIEK